ncbi:MAG: hypothetical protein ACREQY_05840 [Candidatus Binatia bacterium]
MRGLTTQENEFLGRIVRRIDRKVAVEALRLEDGDVELRLSVGRLNTTTRFGGATLEAAATDAMQFEILRGKIKRVCDRMRMPAPPPKAPKVEIQKDVAFGFRPGGRGRR